MFSSKNVCLEEYRLIAIKLPGES